MKNIKKLQSLNNEEYENLFENVKNDILNQTEDDEELKNHIDNIIDNGCISGNVPSLIYYTDTKKFFIENMEDIFQLYNNLKEEYGCEPMQGDLDYNNLSWFAYEEMTKLIALELNI